MFDDLCQEANNITNKTEFNAFIERLKNVINETVSANDRDSALDLLNEKRILPRRVGMDEKRNWDKVALARVHSIRRFL